MKRLISPPIQLFLWLGGLSCLGAAGWNVWQLRQLSVEQHMAQNNIQVEIPGAQALAVPGVAYYRHLVAAPLFWEARAIPRPPPPKPRPVIAKVVEPEVIEVELSPPVGRLVGVVDLGDKRYALVREGDENRSLYKGDTWEGWTVSKINKNKLVLNAGKQSTEVSLIGDFSAPKANKQLLVAKQRQQQRKRHQQLRQQQRQQQVNLRQQALKAAANLPEANEPGQAAVNQLVQALGGNSTQNTDPQNIQKPVPVLSIKEALEARQRLMASRWGSGKRKQGN